MPDQPFFRLKNQIQTYDWGTLDGFSELFGLENPNNEPRAEIWMGAHAKAPSIVQIDGKEYSLDEWINNADPQLLGPKLSNSKSLSFLFKVLSAERALSIQVHPNKQQAIKGFQNEQNKGISLDAFDRNYKDDNHKPELICALTPFVAMCGFRPSDQVLSLLDSLALDFLEEPIDELRTALMLDEASFYQQLKRSYLQLMEIDVAKTTKIVAACENIIGGKPTDNDFIAYKKQSVLSPYMECLLMNETYKGDVAILSPFFMNLYYLEMGKALFLSAGIPHAYLRGTGLEIMASSDNVLRGGLTPKHIDVAELDKVMTAGPHKISLTQAEVLNTNQYHYPVPVDDFTLRVIHQEGGATESELTTDELGILLCISGSVTIKNADIVGFLKAGESAVLPPSSVHISGNGRLAFVSEG